MFKTLGFGLLGVLLLAPVVLASEDAPCWIRSSASSEHALWVLCHDDVLYRSADEGLSWQGRQLPAGKEFRAVAFLDDRRGFLAGNDGALMGTEDGGLSWRRAESPTHEHLTSIHFVGQNGWISGYGGAILHTEDGGRHWIKQVSGVRQTLESIFFADANHGWAVGWVGTILRTTDGGRNWSLVSEPQHPWSLSSIYFRDKDNGWIVGFLGSILRTSDGGLTWRAIESPVSTWLMSVQFDRSGRGWIAADQQVLVSEDGGENWHSLPVEDGIFVSRIQPAGDTIWAVGKFGLLKHNGGEVVALQSVRAPALVASWKEKVPPPPSHASTAGPAGRP